MGCKRPFDEEEFQEFPFKHPKQVDCGNKLTSLGEIYPCYEPTQNVDISGESGGLFYKYKSCDGFEDDGRNIVSYVSDERSEASAPLSWVLSCSTSKQDASSGTAVGSSVSSRYLDLYFPTKPIVQIEPKYSSLWDGSPRKQVPIGQNHQADVSEWDPLAVDKCHSNSGHELKGECILWMPDQDLSARDGIKVGDGRKDCMCADKGSIRCVRLHVQEAREKLRETLGHEKFRQLGFGDMGEEVSKKWTEEEQCVFDEVVYSNPVSYGRNFWEHLSEVFPRRTRMEIVGYYFNVFMLRRRAVQNRSNFLEIDSDDDEQQGMDARALGVKQEDFSIDYEDESHDEDDDDDYDDDDDGSDDSCDASGGNGQGNCSTSENDAGRSIFHHVGTNLDNCAQNGLADRLSPSYFPEPYYPRVWESRHPMSPLRGFDLLSTGKMIEEIFGSCTQNSKLCDDKGFS